MDLTVQKRCFVAFSFSFVLNNSCLETHSRGSYTPNATTRGAAVQCNAYGNASGVKAATYGVKEP